MVARRRWDVSVIVGSDLGQRLTLVRTQIPSMGRYHTPKPGFPLLYGQQNLALGREPGSDHDRRAYCGEAAGTLYATSRNCDSMSAQATHRQADLREPIRDRILDFFATHAGPGVHA
jgi:hypothetical protein